MTHSCNGPQVKTLLLFSSNSCLLPGYFFNYLADIKLALETILRGNGGSVTKYLLQKRKAFHVCLFALVSIRIISLKLKNNSSSLNEENRDRDVDFHDFISPFSP